MATKTPQNWGKGELRESSSQRDTTLGLHDEAGHVSGGTVVGQEDDNSTLISKLRGALVATVDSAGMLSSAQVPPHPILLYFPFLGSVNIYPGTVHISTDIHTQIVLILKECIDFQSFLKIHPKYKYVFANYFKCIPNLTSTPFVMDRNNGPFSEKVNLSY